jgi:hypothetical protein
LLSYGDDIHVIQIIDARVDLVRALGERLVSVAKHSLMVLCSDTTALTVAGDGAAAYRWTAASGMR